MVPRGRFHTQSFFDGGDQTRHGLRGIGAAGLDDQFVALAHAQRHDGHHAARIRIAAVGAQGDMCAE